MTDLWQRFETWLSAHAPHLLGNLREGATREQVAAAVARVLLRSRWPWRPLGALMLVPPISWLAEAVYRIISANRYRLPGATPACAVPARRATRERTSGACSTGLESRVSS